MKKVFTLVFIYALIYSNANAAIFSSLSGSNWNKATTWSHTGIDADGIPDSNDDVTINGGHNVKLVSNAAFKTLLIKPTGALSGNNQNLLAYGDFTNQGTISGTIDVFVRSNCNFSSVATFTASSDWYVQAGTLTIVPGTSISSPSNSLTLTNGTKVSNFGDVNSKLNLSTTGQWINNTNSSLTLNSNVLGTGTLSAAAISNTVAYNNAVTVIYPTTYCDIIINGAFTKSVTTNLTVLKNFTIGGVTTNTLNLGGFNLTVGGNWLNIANSNILNQGIITFNGTGTQTISRISNEVINNMVLGGTGTVLLGTNLDIAQNLSINSGALDVSASNYTVNIGKNLINNSNIIAHNGLFNFNGTSAQTISGSTNTQFYNLTLNNLLGLTVNSAQSLKSTLTVTNGNFNSNGNFTLLSDASTTARIATVGALGSFSGNMTIQQYISARIAGYHDLASPVQNTIIMDWDDELYMSQIGPYDGIVGPAGVDGSAAGNPSVFAWDEATCNTAPNYGWSAVSGSNTPILNGSSLEIFIGDDTSNYFGGTIDTKGVPAFGNKTVNLNYTASQGAYAGTNLVGNPFASAVNFSSCSKTNVTGNVLILDNSGNYTDYGPNPIIPAHQGFWVYASAPGAKIVFNETDKSNSTVTTFYRTVPNYGIKLVFSSPSSAFFHESNINFNSQASLDFDGELDALYLKSPNTIAPAIYMLTDSDARLITNTINSDKENVMIPLAIFTPKEATYYIQPTILNTDSYKYVWIENTKTGKKYDINSSVSILGENNKTNYDFVLRLSKTSSQSTINQNIFENDIIIFSSENDINLKSNNTTHHITELSLYDLSGKLVLQEKNITVDLGQATKINVSSLAKGVYVVNITDISGNQKRQKIVR